MKSPVFFFAALAVASPHALPAFISSAGTGFFSDSAPEVNLSPFAGTPGPLQAVEVNIWNFEIELSLDIDVLSPADGPFDFSPFEPGHPLSLSLFDEFGTLLDFPLDLGRVSLDLSSLAAATDYSASPDLVGQTVSLTGLEGSLTLPLTAANGDLDAAALADFFGDSPVIVPVPVFVDRIAVGESGNFDLLIEVTTTVVSYFGNYSVGYAAIPEPSTLSLFFASGLVLLVWSRRR